MAENHKDEATTFYAESQQAWRNWLEQNHTTAKNVWLIIYHKGCGVPSVYYPEAVDEALCFGWIDSKPNKRDEQSYYQFFSKRNPKSRWSGVNKLKVERLLKEGKMTSAGLAMVELAKKTGTWEALTAVENMEIPADLQALFDANKTAESNFLAFPPSTKRGILDWISTAKTPETRKKRMEETVTLAAQNIRANQYVPKKPQ